MLGLPRTPEDKLKLYSTFHRAGSFKKGAQCDYAHDPSDGNKIGGGGRGGGKTDAKVKGRGEDAKPIGKSDAQKTAAEKATDAKAATATVDGSHDGNPGDDDNRDVNAAHDSEAPDNSDGPRNVFKEGRCKFGDARKMQHPGVAAAAKPEAKPEKKRGG